MLSTNLGLRAALQHMAARPSEAVARAAQHTLQMLFTPPAIPAAHPMNASYPQVKTRAITVVRRSILQYHQQQQPYYGSYGPPPAAAGYYPPQYPTTSRQEPSPETDYVTGSVQQAADDSWPEVSTD